MPVKRKLVLALILKLILVILVVKLYQDIVLEAENSGIDKNVNPGVKLGGILIEKELGEEPDRDDLVNFIEKVALEYETEPQDASIEPSTKEAVPGLNGKEVDIESTLELIYSAKENTEVEPVTESVEPEVTLKELDPAPVYRGNPRAQRVSFICNVAWGGEYIADMLDVLEEYQAQVSFFLEGRWARNNPGKVEKIYENGHEIGNHAYSHYNMSTLNRELIHEELIKTQETIEKIIDKKTELFGPPAGDYDKRVIEEANKLSMQTIMWSLDTVDWMEPGTENMTRKILDNVHPGAFILMHPTEDTVKALKKILIGLQEKSYKVVPVSKQVEGCLNNES